MNPVVRQMTFYSGGFFGYGEEGNFKSFSPAHILPILLLLAVIVLMYKYSSRIRNWKWEREIRLGLAFLSFFCDLSYYYRLMYTGPANYPETSLMGYLPLQVCTWTLLFTAIMAIRESRRMFSMCFFLTMSTGILPLFFPAVISWTGPGYYRYYQFWGEHLLPIVLVFYMMFVHGYRVRPKGMIYAGAWLVILAIPSIYLNERYEDAAYMYLKHGSFSMLDFLPDNTWIVALILAGAVFALFLIAWLIYRFFEKRADKKADA